MFRYQKTHLFIIALFFISIAPLTAKRLGVGAFYNGYAPITSIRGFAGTDQSYDFYGAEFDIPQNKIAAYSPGVGIDFSWAQNNFMSSGGILISASPRDNYIPAYPFRLFINSDLNYKISFSPSVGLVLGLGVFGDIATAKTSQLEEELVHFAVGVRLNIGISIMLVNRTIEIYGQVSPFIALSYDLIRANNISYNTNNKDYFTFPFGLFLPQAGIRFWF